MSDASNPADRKLKAIFAADVPPARDHAFTLDLLKTLERRRLRGELAAQAALAAVAGSLLLAFWPWIQPVLEACLPALGTAVVALFGAAGLLFLTGMADPRAHER